MITVIISAYDRKAYLMDAIKSAISQTLNKKNYEIIVVKNFSDKNIDDYISFNGIKSILSEKPSYSEKIIEALKIARGDIISFLDDDDMYYDNKLEHVMSIFGKSDIVYYHNNNTIVDDNNVELNFSYNNPDFNMSSISVKKKILNTDMLEKIKHSLDTFMYLSAIESKGGIVIDDMKLTHYRMHESITHSFSSVEEYINFNKKSLERVNTSYNAMYDLFKNKKISAS